jgi:hypothetical protein
MSVLRWLAGHQYPEREQLNLQMRRSECFFLSGNCVRKSATLKKKQEYIHIII